MAFIPFSIPFHSKKKGQRVGKLPKGWLFRKPAVVV
jgi:hypothetical protein